MREFSQLPDDLLKTAEKMEVGMSRILGDVSKVIHEQVVYGTPVDTGRARSNWLLSVDEPVAYGILPYAPGEHLGIDETNNAEAAIEQGYKALVEMRTTTERVWIVNNVLYITDLNAGSSPQAAAGFVQLAVHDGGRFAKNQKVFG